MSSHKPQSQFAYTKKEMLIKSDNLFKYACRAPVRAVEKEMWNVILAVGAVVAMIAVPAVVGNLEAVDVEHVTT